MIKAIGITKNYGQLEVLKGIDLEVEAGQLLSLVGASGAGKTSLLQILGTLDKPTKGKVVINGQDLGQFKGDDLSNFRNKNIGFVFQNHNLLPEFTALENICIPGYIGGVDKEVIEKKARQIMKRLGIDHRENNKPSQLSGGEQQRTAVARALINGPAVVFADEPSGNLDSANAQQLHLVFKELSRELGTTFVIVTHNTALASLSDRVLEISDGRLDDR